jgi:hypothetical protein
MVFVSCDLTKLHRKWDSYRILFVWEVLESETYNYQYGHNNEMSN